MGITIQYWHTGNATALIEIQVLLTKAMTAGWMVAILVSGAAIAQGTAIYTCVDAKSRKITSDRPIAECVDRTQQEITPSGTVKRVIGPSLTAQERAAQEEKDKFAAEARAQQQEDKRRDRALLSRYPDRQTHDKERHLVLAQGDEAGKTAGKKIQEFSEQRRLINRDLEFYNKDISKIPPPLKRRLEENESNVALQKRFIADQDFGRQRINQRFDEELGKLRQLWALMGLPATSGVAPVAGATAAKSAKN